MLLRLFRGFEKRVGTHTAAVDWSTTPGRCMIDLPDQQQNGKEINMKKMILTTGVAASILLLAGCSKPGNTQSNSGTSTLAANAPASPAGTNMQAPAGTSPGTAAAPASSTTGTATAGGAMATASSAVSTLVLAMQSGNVKQIENAFTTSTPVQADAVAAEAKLAAIKNQVVQAAQAKLGPQATAIGSLVKKIAPTGGIFPSLSALKNNPLVVKGETAVLNQGKNLASVYFSKIGSNWKIDLQKTLSTYYPDASTAETKLKSITSGFGQATDFLKQVQTGLQNGSITSFTDIETLAAKFEAGGIPGLNKAKSLLHF